MAKVASPFRAYICYRNSLFAQGLRNLLESRRAARIVGMQSNETLALRAVQALKPEVIIVEESAKGGRLIRLGTLLNSAGAGRVVTLSLDHDRATVYQRSRVGAASPAALVRAIRGSAGPSGLWPDSPRTKPVSFRRESGAQSDGGRFEHPSRVPRTRKQGTQASDTLPRASRGSRQGGEKRR